MTSWTPNQLREHLRVKKLQRNLAALEGDYTSQLEQAHSQSERDQLTGKWDFEEEYLEAEIGKIKTNKLVRRAKKIRYRSICSAGLVDGRPARISNVLPKRQWTDSSEAPDSRQVSSVGEMVVLDTYCPRRTSGWYLFVLQLQLASTAPSCPPGGRTVRRDVSPITPGTNASPEPVSSRI